MARRSDSADRDQEEVVARSPIFLARRLFARRIGRHAGDGVAAFLIARQGGGRRAATIRHTVRPVKTSVSQALAQHTARRLHFVLPPVDYATGPDRAPTQHRIESVPGSRTRPVATGGVLSLTDEATRGLGDRFGTAQPQRAEPYRGSRRPPRRGVRWSAVRAGRLARAGSGRGPMINSGFGAAAVISGANVPEDPWSATSEFRGQLYGVGLPGRASWGQSARNALGRVPGKATGPNRRPRSSEERLSRSNLSCPRPNQASWARSATTT
jgi:hypothetical protein